MSRGHGIEIGPSAIELGVKCRKCGRWPYYTRFGAGIRWGNGTTNPQASWNEGLIQNAHSIHYEKGPTPFVLVRRSKSAEDSIQVDHRGTGVEGSVLWAGETMLLDCEEQYQVKGPSNLYGGTDALISAVTGGLLTRPYSILLDVPPGARKPGLVRSDLRFLSQAADLNASVINIPTRGVILGLVYILSSGKTGTPNTQVNPSGALELAGASQSLASGFSPSVTNLTDDGQIRVLAFGEVAGRVGVSSIYGATPSVLNGEIDRFRLDIDGAGTGNLNIDIIVQMRLREDR